MVMKDTQTSFFVKANCEETQLVQIFGKARMRTDQVRVGMGSADIRYRPEYLNWTAELTIDRAVNGYTFIGEGTKIDNLVHVAHGVKIGKHCLIVAGTVIGGSTEIGDRCFLGINCSIKNKVNIGNDVTIGMGAIVLSDVPDGTVVKGLWK